MQSALNIPVFSSRNPSHEHIRKGLRVSTLLEKGSGNTNEDALFTEDSLFGVFDGASSLRGGLFQGQTGAWWASHIASSSARVQQGTLELKMRAANICIRSAMKYHSVPIEERLALWATSAAMVQLDDSHFTYAQIGDALVVAVMHDGSHKLVTPYVNHDAETLTLWQRYAKAGTRDIRQAVQEHIEATRCNMNRTFGVLNGEHEAEHFIHCGTMSLRGVEAILCFTDGLHMPCERPACKGDFTELITIFRQRGLAEAANVVRTIEATDPQCVRYPRFKQHDDIAAVAIRL